MTALKYTGGSITEGFETDIATYSFTPFSPSRIDKVGAILDFLRQKMI
jgi:hypothetical protein